MMTRATAAMAMTSMTWAAEPGRGLGQDRPRAAALARLVGPAASRREPAVKPRLRAPALVEEGHEAQGQPALEAEGEQLPARVLEGLLRGVERARRSDGAVIAHRPRTRSDSTA